MEKKRKYTFSTRNRINKQREYAELFKNGERIRFPEFVLIFRQNTLPFSRLGISVGRKFGNAVKRNRAKRLCRELFRLNQYIIPKGFDMVFLPGRYLLEAAWKKLSENIKTASRKIEQKSGEKARARESK